MLFGIAGLIFCCCNSMKQYNTNENCRTAIRHIPSFSEIPEDILRNIEKMGNDDSEIINKYEAEYLNFIFLEDRDNFDFFERPNQSRST